MRGCLLRRAVPWAVRAASGAVRAAVGALRRVVCRGGEVRAGPVVHGVRCWALGGARWRAGGGRWRAGGCCGLSWGPVTRAPVASAQRWGAALRAAVGPLGAAVAGGHRGPLLCRWGLPWGLVPRYCGGPVACDRLLRHRLQPSCGYPRRCVLLGMSGRGGPKTGGPGPPKREDRNPKPNRTPDKPGRKPNPKNQTEKTAKPIRYPVPPVPRYPENKPPRRRAPVPPGKLSKRKPKKWLPYT